VQALLRLTGRAVGIPAASLVLLTGLALWHAGRFSASHALWLWIALVLYAMGGAVWHWGLIPSRREMGDLAAEAETARPLPGGYSRAARRWLSANAVLLALLGAILVLMIAKPTLP
jgi:uncharacterized membrane protein